MINPRISEAQSAQIREMNYEMLHALCTSNGMLPKHFLDKYASDENKWLNDQKYIEQFMRDIAPLVSNDQMYNLVYSLMDAHTQMKGMDNTPLLRSTSLLSGYLYAELANRLDYDPFDPEKEVPPYFNILNWFVFQNVRKTAPDINACARVILNKVLPILLRKEEQQDQTRQSDKMQMVKLLEKQSLVENIGDYPLIRDHIMNKMVQGKNQTQLPVMYRCRLHATAVSLELLRIYAMAEVMMLDCKKAGKLQRNHEAGIIMLENGIKKIIRKDGLGEEQKIHKLAEKLKKAFDDHLRLWLQQSAPFLKRITHRDQVTHDEAQPLNYGKFIEYLNSDPKSESHHYSRLVGLTLLAVLECKRNLSAEQTQLCDELRKLNVPESYSDVFIQPSVPASPTQNRYDYL